MQYDSAHSRYQGTVSHDDKSIVIDGKAVRVFNEMDPANIKWGDVGADFVVESTGKFLTKDGASVNRVVVLPCHHMFPISTIASQFTTPFFVDPLQGRSQEGCIVCTKQG